MRPHTEAFTQKSVYTKTHLQTEAFTQKSVYTQELLHRTAFTPRHIYRQELLHTKDGLHTCTFTKLSLDTQALLDTELTHRRMFTHRCLYTQDLLHRTVSTQKSFYREKSKSQLYPTFRISTFILCQRVASGLLLHRHLRDN